MSVERLVRRAADRSRISIANRPSKTRLTSTLLKPTPSQTLHNLPLKNKEQHQHRSDRNHRARHLHVVLVRESALKQRNHEREWVFLLVEQHNQRSDEAVPGAQERQD